jgi:DNA polymerase-3 subunit delta
MILFLYGADTYRSKKKLDDIRAKFLRDLDPSGLNLQQFNGERADLSEMRACIHAAPFLVGKRLVIVKDAIASSKKKEGETFSEMLDHVPDDTILVVYEHEDAEGLEGSPAFAKLKAGKFYPEYRPMGPRDVQAWILQEAKARGVAFSREALSSYLPMAGNDAWKIAGELDAMSASARARDLAVIDLDAVRDFSHAHSDESIFDFLDAIGTRRADVAAKLMDRLLQQGETEVSLLSRLQAHVRGLLVACELTAIGQASKDRLARELGIHPFAAAKILSQSRYYKLPELERLFIWLVDADEKLKKGGWPKPRMALDLFLAELALPQMA